MAQRNDPCLLAPVAEAAHENAQRHRQLVTVEELLNTQT
jgi:hypothetical protein